ncbi:hypothetical protein LIER_34073 [Lithospermum erythrorhizon]|uniref:Uncharacterized protein n=1 Tax=Lithospermum erythrorhizon TaxID=34254 RepID=A0AAV3S1Q7_LITER
MGPSNITVLGRSIHLIRQCLSKLGKLYMKVKDCEGRLKQVQCAIFQGDLSQDCLLLERNLRVELVEVSKAELGLLKSKARLTWLDNGDFSTSFFTRSILAYKNKQRIRRISNVHEKVIKSVIEVRILEEAIQGLNSQPTTDEVKQAFHEMANGKCPSPDGISVEFYKYHWKDIQKEIFEAITHIFATSFVPSMINVTTISLIPKVDHPGSIRDYRPISYSDLESFKVIKSTLQLFGEIIGLMLNCNKSKIFLGSTSVALKASLCEYMNMEEGTLPMRYLGVPLSSKKLTSDDYNIFVSKICDKIGSWQTRHLILGGGSYGVGRVDGLIMPNSLGRDYVFHWRMEGWGFKDMESWNQVCMCMLLWNIANRKEVLWVKWIHTVRLRGNSIWKYKKKPADPWHWKKILKVRSLIQNHYNILPGNRETISFWFDNGTHFGPVWSYFGIQERSYVQVPIHATLKEAVSLRGLGQRRQASKVLDLMVALEQLSFIDRKDT